MYFIVYTGYSIAGYAAVISIIVIPKFSIIVVLVVLKLSPTVILVTMVVLKLSLTVIIWLYHS